MAHYLQAISLEVGSMVFHVIMFIWDFLLDLVAIVRLSNDAKDLEILLLRQQLRIVERKQKRGPIIPRWQKIPLAVLAMRLKQKSDNASDALRQTILLFKPETVVSWHRDLVRRKWNFNNTPKSGRPSISSELEQWIVKIAQDNPTFGYDKIEGELRKIGFQISATTIRTILQQHGIPSASDRSENSSSWRTFLNHYQQQFLACDFFTIETLTLQTIYVLFFIEHATRRVHFAGCTSQPDTAWVTQQARQMTWILEDYTLPMCFLIHDHDTKFSRSFDSIFEASDIEIINIPYRAPQANAIAERWVRSVREECLDHLIILNGSHLRRVLKQYIEYYNSRRPHQGIQQQSPNGFDVTLTSEPIRCRKILGGIIKDYYRDAA